MKRIYITEGQLNTLLNKELGIAREVVAISDKIEKIVYTFLDTNNLKHVEKILDDLNLVLVKHYFSNIDDFFVLYKKNPQKFKNGYSYNEKTIYLRFIYIDNILTIDVIENTIQHEVEHYWQCKNKKKPISSTHYQKIIELINSNNPYISIMAEILFFSKKFEIDSEINGAFAELKTNDDIKTIKDVLDNTEVGKLYEKLTQMKISINSWNYNNDEVKRAINVLNIDKDIRKNKNKHKAYILHRSP